MRKTFKIAIFTLMTLCLYSGAALAEHNTNNTEPIMVQDEGNLPYDEWYGPDDAVDTDEGSQSDREDVPELPVNDAREAPEEDPRPQAR